MGPTCSRTARIFALLSLAALSTQAYAAPARNPLVGEWRIALDVGGGSMTSILAVTRGKDGALAGKWISFFGANEIKKIEQEEDQVRFGWSVKFGDQEMTFAFAGTLAKGKLSGTLSSDRGEFKATGERIRPMPPAVGAWDAKVKMGEREYTGTLVVKAGEKGTLSAEWRSARGEHTIADVKFAKGKLSFTRKSKFQEREFESTFEGTVKGNALTGTFTSERGEATLEATRVGAALIGTWNLKVEMDGGTWDQILKVQPDLSGLLGSVPIEKIELDGEAVRFKTTVTFGERTIDLGFEGELKEGKLTGQLSTPQGTRSVEGRKAGRGGQAPAKRVRIKKPDVIFVPTPEVVVEKMLELAKVGKDDLVYDLGCGDGRIVVTAAKKYGCRGVGFDVDPDRIEESLKNVKEKGVEDLVKIEQKDIFTLDLSDASVITLYLLPSLNVKLIPQLEKLKPGSRIVSHDFDMKGVKPDLVVEVRSENQYGEHTVYLWTTPLKKEAASDE